MISSKVKTLAFLIPIVSRILAADEANKKCHVRSIVVAPTKELASQIYDVCRELLAFHAPSAVILQPSTSDQPDDDSNADADAMDTLPSVPAGPYVIPQLLIGGRSKLSEDLITFATINPNLLIGTPKRLVEVLGNSRVVLKRHVFDLLVLRVTLH